ncbi:MAG TPA: hypothetical protein VLF14_05930 [Candidatus Binatia bacterium]|nr:hypothetical protein [Candidatus Binatia bacterium]
MRTWTEADFAGLSWHDNHIHAIALRVGEPAAGDWTSDLVLDIDHILEWVREEGGRMRFRIAPAKLVFHGVTDRRIHIDDGSSGLQVAHGLPSIHRIEREPIADQKVFLDRPYYRWRVELNAPRDGEITFGAVGFTQMLESEPVLCEEQWLTRAAARP